MQPGETYLLASAGNVLYSACLQCNTGCGIKVKLLDGVAAKIDGNPYNPFAMVPHIPFGTPVQQAATIDAPLCPKGQAGMQSVYDPYRIVKVLKRAGPRGSNRWEAIPFDQAVREIVEGGRLFADIGEDRHVPGLREVWVLRDPTVAKAMAKAVREIWAEKDKAKKRALVAEFKQTFKDHLHVLIDPDHPDLGPKNNQFLYFWGRQKAGRGDFARRFVQDSFGSVNFHGHTTVCQGSLYFACKAMSEQFVFDDEDGKMKWTKGRKWYWQADTEHSEFVIFVGASPFEGNYGPTNRVPRMTEGLASGRLKIAVVDPRLSKTAAKAWKWIPARPGSEGALALAMIRWIIEQRRFDERFLRNANKASAAADGEPSWSNAAWLVKIEKGKPGAFLRASDLGLPVQTRKKTVKDKEVTYEFDPFVVLRDGTPVAFDPYDDQVPVEGDLLVATAVKGVEAKSALQLLWEEAASRTIEQWAKICGVPPADIVALAREFTSHGKKAAADVHRGVSQHTNGFYNVLAWMALNLLIGNLDWKGGLSWAKVYDPSGEKEGQPFPMKDLHPARMTPFGVSIIRHETKYEDSTIFRGYPARRPWYPLSSDIYQEIVPSVGDAYPYPIKIAYLYMGSPVYALPAGHTNIEVLKDPQKLPLFIACDIVVGETSMYADYIIPDLSFLERWEFQGTHPSMTVKVQPVRQPVIPPIPETAKVFGEELPVCHETFLLACAERLGLPGFGKNGFGPGQDFRRPEDFYLRMVANVAAGDKPGEEVPDASAEEVALFLQSRRHLPKAVFDPDKWRQAVGDRWWRKVVYVLNRGGRFQDYKKAFKGEHLGTQYGQLANLYMEKVAKTKHAMTGKSFPGLATYIPAPQDITGKPVDDENAGFDLHLITYREISHTKSRTASNYWLLALLPENFVLMNRADAGRIGLRDGDRVKVTSASNPDGVWALGNGQQKPMVGKVKVTEGIRPGVIAFSLGHGHWAYGSGEVVIDGRRIRADERRGRGIHANAAMRIDPVLADTCLSDPVGGSAVFYDTKVKLIRVA
jgi:anaerobic selenocysteine-containing dehydrogenase